ncbi:MAG: IS200/IS605 family transposase [Candidatus Binatia bacterium]
MAQSLGRVLVHVIYSTKNRRPDIAVAARAPLHAQLASLAQQIGCDAVQVGGTADHVHALVSIGRVHAVAEVVQHMKVESSKWMKARGAVGFAWQAGYGAFSIGASQVDAVVRYIQRQEAHHRVTSFQDELRRVLQRYGVPFDERYVWR